MTIVVGALAAALATLVAASTAFAAAPEFESTHPFPIGFTSKTSAGATVTMFNKTKKIKVTCVGTTSPAHEAEESTSGEVVPGTNKKEVANVEPKFFGCTATENGSSCGSVKGETSTNTGEITLAEALKGELGEVATGKVGIVLKPTLHSKFVKLASSSCGNVNAEVSGAVIGEVTPLNVEQTTGTITYKESAAGSGTQEFTKFVGGSTMKLTAFGSEAALEGTLNITFAKALKVT